MRPATVLQHLTHHRGGLDPARLCVETGSTEAELGAALGALRAEGHRIVDVGGRLTLAGGAGWGPETLAMRLDRPVVFRASCASTNRLARELAASLPVGAALPVVVADHQTAGRGRRGRTWQTVAGQNLLFSVVLRPRLPPARIPRAVLAWAAAMAEVLDVSLKWPNDLVVLDGDRMRKLGGILAELETMPPPPGRPAPPPTVVLGVGINVGQRSFEDLPDATSLALLHDTVPDRAGLLSRLVAAIDAVDVHAGELLAPWRARACMLGRVVRVGERTGVAQGIRDDGALILDGTAVLTGDVELVAGLEPT